MVPDRQPGIPGHGDAAAESGALLDSNTNVVHTNGLTTALNFPPNQSPTLSARKVFSDHLPPQNIDRKPSPKDVIANGAFWPPLKAIPLANFYKLHRVPSQPDMEGTHENSVHEIPRSETSSTEPPNGVQNRLLEQVIRTPGRQPSPQPTHLGVPGPPQPRVLHEEGSGYVAPKFEGKDLQMDQGMPVHDDVTIWTLLIITY